VRPPQAPRAAAPPRLAQRGMALLSESQRRVLRSVCEAFCPSLSDDEAKRVLQEVEEAARSAGQPASPERLASVAAWCSCSADELRLADAVEASLARNVKPANQQQMRRLLDLLGTSLGTLLLCGRLRPFADMARGEREECLSGLQRSVLFFRRAAFRALKTLTTGHFVNVARPEGGPNPAWSAMGYPAPAPAEQVAEEARAAGWDEYVFQMINSGVTSDVELEVDAVIVGSGCGGAVAAARLADGNSVLVLDKGTYFRRSDMDGTELSGFSHMYEQGALLETEDQNVVVLAGATFGGGSSINWACCLRTPDFVREEWASAHGLARFGPGSASFDAACEAVCKRIGVREGDDVAHNVGNSLMIDGCRACGYSVRVTGQNMKSTAPDAPGAGNISIGDRHGIKNSMPETFLQDAARLGCRFADRCRVERVLHSAGRASGVVGTIVGKDGTSHSITVRARRAVVVSCGSIHTPALLLRSGLPNRNGLIGKNLRLHPVVAVVGLMPEPVEAWRGAPMTTVSDEAAAGTDGSTYGIKLEVPSMHPGLAAALMPWFGAAQFRAIMLKVARAFPTIALCRDRGSGEVRIDGSGSPQLYYPVAQHDREQLARGAEMLARIAAGAGAESIAAGPLITDGFYGLPRFAPAGAPEEERRRSELERAEALEHFCGLIRQRGIQTDGRGTIFSAHQMGTAKMSASPDKGVCKETGEVWEVNGLYVIDASLFPTPSGSNPMLTTLTLAYDIAGRLRDSLRQEGSSSLVAPRSRL